MGQFGPTFAAGRGIRRFSDSAAYVVGVLASSFLFLLAVDAAGGWFGALAGSRGAVVTALALAGMLALIDALRVWGGRSMSFGPGRQTPYAWRAKGLAGVVAWGLDTGLPVSTVRATPLPLLGVILAATGHAGPFHGLFYGLGVTLGLLAGLPAARSSPRIDRVMDNLTGQYRTLGPVVLLLAPSGLTVAALGASLAQMP